jgi:hypothetical protein
MLNLFVGSTYKTRHELVTKENVEVLLKDDIRSKIVGNQKLFIYGSKPCVLEINNKIKYMGGFYYEENKDNLTECENVVYSELSQIDKSDLIIIILHNYSAIATITELMYASLKKKKIVIFCDPKITRFEIDGEYWFPIIAAKKINDNIEVIFSEKDSDIIDYIEKLEVE